MALAFVATGCGGNIDKDELEKNKVTDHLVEREDDDVSTTISGENQSSEKTTVETTTVSETTTTVIENTTTEVITTTIEPTTVVQTTIPTTTIPPTTKPTTTQVQKPSYTISVNTPVASGSAVVQTNGHVVDYSNANDGYVMVKPAAGYTGKICIQVFKDSTDSGNMLAQYINTNVTDYVTFSLVGGSGKYIVRVVEMLDKNYLRCTAEFNVSLKSATTPYVYPCYNMNFSKYTVAVDKAYELCAGVTSDREKVAIIKKFVEDTLSYDYSFADLVENKDSSVANYIPNVDNILAKGKGICYDYSCLFGVMLRCQNIPTKMVHGYVPSGGKMVYHAWNEVYYDGSWHQYDTTYTDGGGSMSSSYTKTREY